VWANDGHGQNLIWVDPNYTNAGVKQAGYQPDWSFTYGGCTITWTLDTKTLSFSVPLQVASDWESAVVAMLNRFSASVNITVEIGQWVDTEIAVGNPDYPRRIISGGSKTGAITGLRLTDLVTASRYMKPVTETPDEKFVLNGVLTCDNPNGSWDGQPWTVTYASRSNTVKYSRGEGGDITVYYSLLGETITLNDGNGWVYPSFYFDPVEAFDLDDNFYYQAVTGDPWSDTWLLDYRRNSLTDVAKKAEEAIPVVIDDSSLQFKDNTNTEQIVPKYFEPSNGDYSIETVLPAGFTDFEFGFTTQGLKPLNNLPGNDYNGDMLAIGGQKQFDFGDDPDGSEDTESTAYVFNVGDSNVDKQILSYHRPFWYNGKTSTRHWIALKDDIPAPSYQHNVTLTGVDGDGNNMGCSFTVVTSFAEPYTAYPQFPAKAAIPVSGVINVSGEGVCLPYSMNSTLNPPAISCMMANNGNSFIYQPPAQYWTATITDTVTVI
jgi:hypothetical protein